MIKLMKYLKKSAGYIVLIIALLFLQAYCDLSLPDYTSKIINVGIQQKGIEDSVPDKLRDSTLQNLQIFMDEDQKKEVSQNYTQEDDTWLLNDDISKETRENLNEDFSKAMMMVAAFSEDSEQGQAMAAQMGLPEGTDPLTALAQMPEEAVQQIMSQMDEKLKDMPESIVTQAGVSFVASEYEALGKDVDAMLPFLSAYMGHARFEDTAYYIHMVPDFYQRTGKLDVSAYETLLPEVYHEDQE